MLICQTEGLIHVKLKKRSPKRRGHIFPRWAFETEVVINRQLARVLLLSFLTLLPIPPFKATTWNHIPPVCVSTCTSVSLCVGEPWGVRNIILLATVKPFGPLYCQPHNSSDIEIVSHENHLIYEICYIGQPGPLPFPQLAIP